MSSAKQLLSLSQQFANIHLIFLRGLNFTKNVFALAKAAFRLIYHLSLKPFIKTGEFLLWSPTSIILRNLMSLVLLPSNILLVLFYNTTISDLAKINVHMTTVTIMLCLQYFITMVIVGLLCGVYCGMALGFIHRFIRIPDKHIDILRIAKRWFIPETTFVSESPRVVPSSWESGHVQSPSNITHTARTNSSSRRISRSSVSGISRVASKLPHDFFQVKGPMTPLGRSPNTRYDTSRLSPLSPEVGEESTSISSNIWDTTEGLPETFITEATIRGSEIPRSAYATGAEFSKYARTKDLKLREGDIEAHA
ncbi:LADA_0H16050g1_1 [Lachancea dasiensis]|uniref:LADA_0H16050g1_1 n=1 Tax=Lachancea dasiensis TaxID=1072105 RepID=A0A1G4K535_9SACH|nr:LADA_0H16050g1_1 [Lachancea dasiensis]